MFFLSLLLYISIVSGDYCDGGDVYTPSSNQYACIALGDNDIVDDSDRCIHIELVCDDDMNPDCPYGDDEWSCPTYDECIADGGYDCPYSTRDGEHVCIFSEWGCDAGDTIWDCPLQEDVSSQFCDTSVCEGSNRNYFQCADTGRCIQWSAIFNGYSDCLNGMDEDDTLSYVAASALSTDISYLELNVSMAVQVKTDEFCMTVIGPSIVWFGIGFGSQLMDHTYAIIFNSDGSVNEMKLGTDHATNQTLLNRIVTVWSNVVSGDFRRVSLCRNASISNNTDYFSFTAPLFNTDVIWAYGTRSSDFLSHFASGSAVVSWHVYSESSLNTNTRVPIIHTTRASDTTENPSISPTIHTTAVSESVATATPIATDDNRIYIELLSGGNGWTMERIVIIVLSIVSFMSTMGVCALVVYICKEKSNNYDIADIDIDDDDNEENSLPTAIIKYRGRRESTELVERPSDMTGLLRLGAAYSNTSGITDV